MNDENIRVIPHPVLQEIKFPKRKLITLDITKFNSNSATECFTAVQNAIKEHEERR